MQEALDLFLFFTLASNPPHTSSFGAISLLARRALMTLRMNGSAGRMGAAILWLTCKYKMFFLTCMLLFAIYFLLSGSWEMVNKIAFGEFKWMDFQ
jgi:hypothetical protein